MNSSLPPDDESFPQLYEKYLEQIVRYFMRQGCSKEEALDLTQDVFIRVYKAMGTFRRESQLSTWLFTIAKNRYKNLVRSRRTEKRSGDEVSMEALTETGLELSTGDDPNRTEVATPEEATLAHERHRVLRGALAELPPKMRRAVQLRLDQGLKYREIAVIMDVSIQTVKSQLFQARQRLRSLLEHYFDTDELTDLEPLGSAGTGSKKPNGVEGEAS